MHHNVSAALEWSVLNYKGRGGSLVCACVGGGGGGGRGAGVWREGGVSVCVCGGGGGVERLSKTFV